MIRAGRSIAALALALSAVSACARAPRPPAPASPAAAVPADVEAPPPRSDLEARRWLLQRDAALAIAEGAGPLTVIAADVGTDGDRVGAFIKLPGDACVLVYARGSEGVDDLDMLAFADDGTPLGSDEATDPHPGLLLCPPQPGRAYVVARVAAGRGLVAVGAHSVPLPVAYRVRKALNARGRPGEAAKEPEVWPGLDAKTAASRKDLGGRWEEVRRVALPLDARAPARLTFKVDAGRCAAVLVTPSDETSDLDVQIADSDGRIVGRGSESGRDRTAVVCSTLTTEVTLELRPRIAAGLAAVVLANSVAGTEADIQARPDRLDTFPSQPLADLRAKLGGKLKSAGYETAPSAQAIGTAATGRRSSFQVALPKGCARIDVLGGAPLAGMVADLWSESGSLLGHAEGGSGAALFACGEAQKARVDVEAVARPGPLAVEVRREPAGDAALLSAGLAGGRLLARFNASGEIVRAESLSGVRALPLDASTLKSVDLRVPEKRCVEIGAATAAGGSGVDLRLVDATSHEEVALARAGRATVVRGCAGTSAVSLTLEVRLAAGKADVLLGTRVTDAK